mgnify:CR=1 FL=1
MPIQPIECRCQSSADGHRSISVPIHWPDWVPIDLSVHRPKRSHHIVPSSALGVFRRVHRFAWTFRVDIALHHQARSKCIQECSNAFIASRGHRSAPRPLFEVRRCNLHANLGEPRSLTEQQLSCSPESRSMTPMMSLTDGKEEA